MAKTKTTKSPDDMSFLDHLEDFRWHIIRSLIAIIIAGFAAFLAKDFIFDVIIFGPKNTDFITYRYLCEAAKLINMEGGFCLTEIPFQIISRSMAGQFSAHIWTAVTAGFIIAFPYVLYEMWRFISPALKQEEKSASKGFIFVASFLFFIGVLFGYYIIAPLSINFLGSYFVSSEVSNNIDLSSYISLVRAAALSSGIVFELPIIIYILTKLGLVTPSILRQYRKYAFVVILIISAIITPPDIASQVIVAIPVMILYEVSIKICGYVLKKQEKKEMTKKKNQDQ